MNEVLKKSKRKCIPIVITPEIREQIKFFKEELITIRNNPTESSEFDARTIDIILNELDDYDRNILIAYYAIADGSSTKLSTVFNISPPILLRKIKVIHNKIQELNDVPKTTNNKPRCNPCD